MTIQNTDAVARSVLSMIAAACNRDPRNIGPDADVIELGLDSLNLTTLVGELEYRYGRDFNEDQLMQFYSAQLVRDIVVLACELAHEA